MNSSARPPRRIAANLLWTDGGFVRCPVAEIGPDGRVRSVGVCPEPDREPCTEFYAGVLVPEFPADYRAAFAAMMLRAETPLSELLAGLPGPPGVPVVISGLDYRTMRLTPQARIRRIR